MREEGRVPYNTYMARKLRERRKAKGGYQPQEAPGDDAYRKRLRRQRQIYQMLRDGAYREGE